VLRKVIQNTAEQDRVMAQLNATLKSTGGVAGRTSEELAKTAAALQKVSTFGDEAIISAQSLLLTFKNVRGDEFDRATRAILDMSTALGRDLNSSALQLGKALENPIKGINALTRSGVSFSEAQKDVIKGLAESGRLAEAQTLILKELETQFGGSAEAARGTLGGAIDSLAHSWGDLFEVQQTASAGMTESINSLNSTISDPEFKKSVDTLITGLIDVVNWSVKGASALVWFFETARGTRSKSLVDLADQIDQTTKAIVRLEQAGKKNSASAGLLRGQLLKLQDAYDAELKAINNKGKSLAQLTPVIVTATQRTSSFAAATQKSASACATAAKEITQLSPIIVTATRRTSDFATASEEAADTTSQVWSDTRGVLSDFFFEMAADGQNAFNVLINGFRRMLTMMIAEAAANRILLAVGIGTSGTASAAGGAASSLGSAAGSGFSSLVSGGISGIGGAVQGGFNALATGYEGVAQFATQQGWHGVAGAAQTSAGQYAGSMGASVANLGLNVGAGMVGTYAGQKVFQNKGSTGIGATGGAIVGSIWGPVGTAIGAFVGEGIEKAFASAFGYSGQKKNRAMIGFDTATDTAAATSGKHDKDNLRNANDLFSVINQMADMLGGNLSGTIRVSNRDGVEISGLGKFKSSTDALKAITERLIETSTTISESLKPLILDFKGTTEEVTRFAVAISSINTMAGINTVTNAIKDFALVQPNATESYKTHTDALKDQIRAFDGSLSAAENLNTVLNENKTAAYQFALSIQSIGRSISEMAGGQAASIRESVLTPQQLLNRRYDQRDTLAASLLTESDPERAAATAQRLLEVNKQIFDSITDDQQLLFAENFAKVAEDTNSVTQYILQKSLDGLKTTQDELNSQVSAMLQKLATDNQKAAEMQLQAANINLQAAQLNGGRGQVAV
jgi:hypothetical protein